MSKDEIIEVCKTMKDKDKAIAFDLIVEKYAESPNVENLGEDVNSVLLWCSMWCSKSK